MPWEVDKVHRTLFIEDRGKVDGRKRFSIHPMCRVMTDEGTSYLEAIPYELFVQGTQDLWRFDAIEYISPRGMNQSANSTDLDLTNFGDLIIRRTA